MKLRPYQKEAVNFILDRESAGLFIDMGLGKTAATLHAMLDLPRPVLLVGPIAVIENVWMQEAKKWPKTKGLTFSLVRGTPKQRKAALAKPADVYLINPEGLEWLFRVTGKKHPFKTLVVDESSMFKNPSSMRFKILRANLKPFERRVILTGTPTPNSLMELWPQIFMLDQGQRLETSFYRFRNRYFQTTDWQGYKWEPKAETEDVLPELIADVIFRVEGKGNLPDRSVIHNEILLDLDRDARKTYDQMEQDAITELNDEHITAASAVAVMMKLRQVTSGFLYDEARKPHAVHKEKLKAARRIVDETGSPALIFYQFQEDLRLLQEHFPEGRVFSTVNKPAWDKGELPVMFLHPQSAGHGVNLQQGGHTGIIYSASFSYEQMAQAMARIDRQGQEHPVVFHHLIVKDSVDVLLREIFLAKQEGQLSLLDAIKEYADAANNG